MDGSVRVLTGGGWRKGCDGGIRGVYPTHRRVD